MFIERNISPTSGSVELWWATEGPRGQRTLVSKFADEQPLVMEAESRPHKRGAVCWAYGRTLGNIEVRSPDLLQHFTKRRATDVSLPCDFVYAGKYRHGAERWWCRTHQNHWGTKADIAALRSSNEMRCANHAQAMNYEIEPYTVDLNEHAEVGIWCSLPAALSTSEIRARAPKIHVHVRDKPEMRKRIDKDFAAISAVYSRRQGLFGNGDTIRVDITPPAAFDFVCALEAHKEMGCIDCSSCGHPHLDLGDFGKTAHRKHFCANCGRDSTWSKSPIISTPLQPLHDRTATYLTCLLPDRSLNLDDYKEHSYTVWASTPAIVWTANRPQEYGIHVHVHHGADRIVDDTFGKVILNGKALVREELLQAMIDRAIV
jgi:hypothetical protein